MSARASRISTRPAPSCASTCPEVKFVVAHGQMAATELEDKMAAFYDGQYDVLLSTAIVESGLDIPDRQHAHRASRRYVRPRPALSIARPGRALENPRLCALHRAGQPHHDAAGRTAPEGAAIRSTRSAPASSSRATISTFAAPAICSATSSPAISRKSATNSTSRCCARRSRR